MTTDTELQTRAAALSREITTAAGSFVASIKDAPGRGQPLKARGDALVAEDARRARAGVRVTMSAGDFDARRLAFFADLVAHVQTVAAESARAGDGMVALLSRAVTLIAEMSDALTAPERAAAAPAHAAEEAARERAEAPGKYLEKLKADDEMLQRLWESAARSAPAPAAGLAGRIEW